MKKVFAILAASIAVMSTGCSKYVVQYTGAPSTPKEKMRIVVYAPKDADYWAGSDDEMRIAFENTLMNEGFPVVTGFEDNFYTSKVNSKTDAGDNKSVMQGIMKGVEQGKVEGNKDFFSMIKDWNNIKDETVRVQDYRTLLKEMALTVQDLNQYWGVTHVVEVLPVTGSGNDFKYNVRVTKLPENSIAFQMSFWAKQDESSFNNATSNCQIPSGAVFNTSYAMTKKDIASSYYRLRFASFVVKKFGGK